MSYLKLALFRYDRILSGLTTVATLGMVAAISQPANAASLIPVDTELSLLIDVSPSINTREYDLQLEGYQTAFTNVASRFGSGDFGSVAVNLIRWSGVVGIEESISWTLLNDESSALELAEAIGNLTERPNYFGTAPGAAIEFATPLFSTNEYDGQRWVIDVSGDGRGNSGVSSIVARDNALAAGVDAINGLPILPTTSNSTLDIWYETNIQGGDGAFTITANGFEDIGRALEQKLIAELTLPPSDPEPPIVSPEPPPVNGDPSAKVPEPMTLWGLGLVLGGMLYRSPNRPD